MAETDDIGLATYQILAKSTARINIETVPGQTELVFGLVSEVGSLASAFKRLLRDDITLESQRHKLEEDVGDVLWYLAMIATSLGLELSTVARANLHRTQDHYEKVSLTPNDFKPKFEENTEKWERFPRRALFRLRAIDENGSGTDLPQAAFSIEDANPNYFANGPLNKDGKVFGFELGASLGDTVDDNSSRDDGYRYHDAVHVAFMTVLGWSPVMRRMLQLKRKSDPEVDRVQDGARARDLEEALSAILKEYSQTRNGFAELDDIDGETRDIIRKVVGSLEVSEVPVWLWARAIKQGYSAMRQCQENNGGWLVADLDQQTLEYFKDRPEFKSGTQAETQ